MRRLGGETPAGFSGRDCRDLPWSSIDNAESRDLDQLEVAFPAEGGATRLLVAIADVDQFVPAGSALDAHAARNGTSLYVGADVLPMLPEEISAGASSLLPGEDRAAIVLDLQVASDGSVEACEVFRALVRNGAKLAYEEVSRWLEGGIAPDALRGDATLQAQVRLQHEAATRLRKLRSARGALELDTIDARVVGGGGDVVGIELTTKGPARDLIEDLMIAANESAARYLDEHGRSSLRRVVRAPARWDRLVALASRSGEALPPTPDAPALAAFLERRRAADPAHFPDLSLSVVKLLGAGEYVVDPPGGTREGHFGLAVSDYAHSTAPNRRYADLVTQRLLKAAIARAPAPYSDEELAEIARQCTERENAARAVERQVRKQAGAMLLDSRIGDRFEAIVTGLKPDGAFVRVITPPVEGRLMDPRPADDVGETLRVRLADVNVARGYIDFVHAD